MASHAARMDAVYARQRHIYDLTRKYYLLGRDRLIARLDVPPGGSVLEIGCGTARNLISAGKRYPHARLFGLDISEAMLATAQSQVAAAGLTERVRLAQGDASGFDASALFGETTFDRVFLSYTLSMIPDWRGALRQALAATGGRLILVDFGQQEGLPSSFRRALFAWLARFDVTPRADLAEAVTTLAASSRRGAEFERLYLGYAWSATIS